MIKDKLHTITDEQATAVALILIKSAHSSFFEYTLEKIERRKYDTMEGTDAEECVNVYFNAKVKEEMYKKSGWKDKQLYVQLIECDRYHDHPYFCAHYKESDDKGRVWNFEFLANQVEAVEYLQNLKLI